MSAKLWIIKAVFQSRTRSGVKYMKRTVCVQRGSAELVGDVLYCDGKSVRLPGSSATVIRALMLAPGIISRQELMEYVYPDVNREPEMSLNCVSQFIIRARNLLAASDMGIHIVTHMTMGFEFTVLPQAAQAA